MALTDEQLQALGLAMPPPAATMTPAPLPSTILPASTVAPQSSLGAKILPDQLIPKNEMSAAYKAGGVSPADSYEAAMPKIAPDPTASLGTYDWQKQRGQQIQSQLDQMEFKTAHPWGSPESTHPGVLGSILHGLATAGNIAGDVVAPNIMAHIPGTQMYKDIQHSNLEKELEKTGEAASKQSDQDVKNEHTQAETDALENPKAKEGLTPEETTIHDLMTGDNGQPRVNPDTKKPYSYLEAYQAMNQAKQDTKPPEKQTDFEQYYKDYITDNHLPDSAHNRMLARQEYARAGQAPQHEQRQMIVTPDGTVVEVKPGMKVPQGSKTLTGDLAGAKPNAEELKRSEMAENMGENLDKLEDIVKRRPDLFGPLAGRMTQGRMLVGSNDPDIGALNTIKDQIGMAQQSAHSMRSAQHVEAAANSILNGFKNGPDAINTSIKTARDSLKTFTKDVQEGNPSTKKDGGKKTEKKDNDPMSLR